MVTNEQKDFQKRLGRIEGLIQSLDRLPDPNAQATAKALVQALLDLHGTGLERLLEITYDTGAAGQAIIADLARDDLVGSLLLLHGLHPLSLEERVLQALEKVRPYMRSHGGNVELLDITPEGRVRLRLAGSCQSCPSSTVTLKYAVEEAIYAAAPDVTGIEAEGAAERQAGPPLGFVPMEQLFGAELAPAPQASGWVDVSGLAAVGEGSVRTLDVSGQPVLFGRLDGAFYAYGDTCPNCGQRLEQGRLAGPDLTCARCGHRYDLMRAGRDLDEPRLHLEPFPLLEERGQVKVALRSFAPS